MGGVQFCERRDQSRDCNPSDEVNGRCKQESGQPYGIFLLEIWMVVVDGRLTQIKFVIGVSAQWFTTSRTPWIVSKLQITHHPKKLESDSVGTDEILETLWEDVSRIPAQKRFVSYGVLANNNNDFHLM